MKINHERAGNGYGYGYNYDRGGGNGYGGYGNGYGGYGNGYGGYGGDGDGYGRNKPYILYLLHPFAPLADFDAWMLHLQVNHNGMKGTQS